MSAELAEEIAQQELLLTNPEATQEQLALKLQFSEELFQLQNKNKIEVRIISKAQVDTIIDILSKPDKNKEEFIKLYYYKKKYSISKTQPPQLCYKEEGDGEVAKVVVPIEEMFDACLKVHKAIGYQGRTGMEKEGSKHYCNMTRTVIEIFLKYSVEFQLKRKKPVNHGMVVKPIKSDHFNQSPYNALFGHESYVGLDIFTTLTSDQKSSLKTVKQLFELLGKIFSVAILFVSIPSNI